MSGVAEWEGERAEGAGIDTGGWQFTTGFHKQTTADILQKSKSRNRVWKEKVEEELEERRKGKKRVSIGWQLYFYLFERLELDELPELLLEKLGSSRSMSLQEKRT